MTRERWEEIRAQAKSNFGAVEEYSEDLDPGIAEVLEFSGPTGKIRLKLITRPKVIDKKTTYSHRIGSGVRVDYLFSDTETVSHLEAYIWSDQQNDWQKFSADSLF